MFANLILGTSGNNNYVGSPDTFDVLIYSGLGEQITLLPQGIIEKEFGDIDTIEDIDRIVGDSNFDNVIDGNGATNGTFEINLSLESLTILGIPVLGNLVFSVLNFVDVNRTSNNDEIIGDSKDNNLFGDGGDDFLDGDDGDDFLSGGSGNDTLIGGIGNDTLNGGIDNDILSGNNGNDYLTGGSGNDNI